MVEERKLRKETRYLKILENLLANYPRAETRHYTGCSEKLAFHAEDPCE